MFKKENCILLIILFFLASCGSWDSLKRGLTGQKQKSIDEFLVKKKDPLILPPNYDVLPTPGERARAKKKQSEFEKLILNQTNVVEEESSAGTSVENVILKKIKKNK